MLRRRDLNEILNFSHKKLPVVSIYLDRVVGREEKSNRIRLKNMLQEMRHVSERDDIDHDVKMSLRGDIEKIESIADSLEAPETPGVAVFSCSGAGFFHVVPLPRRVRDRLVIEQDPYVRPMTAILDEYRRFCAVVVDTRQARFFEYYMGELLDTGVVIDEGVRKKNFAGYYGLQEHNVRNHAREVANRHYREVARQLFLHFKAHGYDLLFVGGHETTVSEFLPFLHSYLKPLVASTFVIDPSTMTEPKLREVCAQLEREFEAKEEVEMVSRLMDAAANERAGVLGLERVLDAANVAAIDTLLINGDVVVPGAVCDQCGWLSLSEGNCPNCNVALRPVGDVIDELTEDVINEGGSVEHIYADTPLKEHQVGAFTRFPVPRMQEQAT